MKVFKYLLRIGSNMVELQEPAKILSVQVQDEKPYLYVLVDEEEKKVKKHIKLVMTGHDADLFNFEYIGTLMLEGGEFVLHAFVEAK